MIKSYQDFKNSSVMNESVTMAIIGVIFAVYALRFFGELTTGFLLNVKLSKEDLTKIVDGMIEDAVNKKVVNAQSSTLMDLDFKKEIDLKIENGEIKTPGDIKKFLKNYVTTNI